LGVFMKRFLPLFLMLGLVACEVGPDYKAPDLSLPGNWFSSGSSQVTKDANAAIDENWWKNFNDPELNDLITRAAEGNFDLKIAEARIEGARAARASAGANLLPTVNMTGSAVRQANQFAIPGSFPGMTTPFNTYQAGFDASWELDLFGGHK